MQDAVFRTTQILSKVTIFPSLIWFTRCEGGAPWFDTVATKIPKKNNKNAIDEYLDETEVQTRMSLILHGFKLFDLHTINWDANFEEVGMDSLE